MSVIDFASAKNALNTIRRGKRGAITLVSNGPLVGEKGYDDFYYMFSFEQALGDGSSDQLDIYYALTGDIMVISKKDGTFNRPYDVARQCPEGTYWARAALEIHYALIVSRCP